MKQRSSPRPRSAPDLATAWWDALEGPEQDALNDAADAAALEVRTELDRLPDRPRAGPRRSATGAPPSADENPCNAWAWRCRIQEAPDGPLAGRTVALKDAVAVAGLPLTGGSRALEGYRPERDATVVSRILGAGGTIAGVATTEDMSFSGVSITSLQGPVRNPWDEERSVGGSSSGVAALLALGEVDLGVGADQGGSIRLPASMCGVFGLKPTYGLVPYTGCLPIDPSIDHVGPMARTAADLALLLNVVAGDDQCRDPRQRLAPASFDSTSALEAGVVDVRIGVLREGFEPDIEARVEEVVRSVAMSLGELGAQVREISVPEHSWGLPVHTAIILQGAAQHMLRGLSMGVIGKGDYDGDLARTLADGLEHRGHAIAPGVKVAGLAGAKLWDDHRGSYYAKAQNLARWLRARYDEAFETSDLLLMPTTLITAPAFPDRELPPLQAFLEGSDSRLVSNACGFNQTGHPAVSVPVGAPEQLPVGLMLVGRRLGDDLVVRAAHALEGAGLTRPLANGR